MKPNRTHLILLAALALIGGLSATSAPAPLPKRPGQSPPQEYPIGVWHADLLGVQTVARFHPDGRFCERQTDGLAWEGRWVWDADSPDVIDVYDVRRSDMPEHLWRFRFAAKPGVPTVF